MSACQNELDRFMHGLEKRNPHETEFHQPVAKLAESVMPGTWITRTAARYKSLKVSPNRIVSSVSGSSWETDAGDTRANRAWCVQFNHAIGSCKGGLRFHPTAMQSVGDIFQR